AEHTKQNECESMKTTLNLETLLPWSEPKRVSTRNGDRLLRKAAPTEAFSAVWRAGKEALKAAGISWSKDERTGNWEVCWWAPLDAGTVAKETAAVAASKATDADVTIPAPEGLEYLPFQRAGVKVICAAWKAGKSVLLGDEMGLGKSCQSIASAIISDSFPLLIVCPATL